MRFNRAPSSQAGTSVIAALVVAVVLGAVALGLHVLQPNSAALPAAAADSTTNSSSQQQTVGNKQTCQQIVAAAISSRQDTPPRTVNVPNSSDKTVNDSCNAVIWVNGPAASGVTYSQADPLVSGATYECVGMSGTIADSGALTVTLKPDASVKAGTCDVKACTYQSADQTSSTQVDTTSQGQEICSSTNYPSALNSSGSASSPSVTPNTTNPQLSNSTPQSCNSGTYDANLCMTYCQQQNLPPTFPGCNGQEPSASQTAVQTTGPGVTTSNNQTTTPPPCTANSTTACSTDNADVAQGLADNHNMNCSDPNSNDVMTCTPNTPTQTPPPASGAVTCSQCNQGQICGPNGQCQTVSNITTQQQTKTLTATPAKSATSPIISALTGFATGLARGLTPCPTTGVQSPYVGGNGTTLVPQQVLQSNGTYATVYVQQQTIASPYASPYGAAQPCGAASPLSAAQAPYGVGTNGAACPQPAAQPNPAQCTVGTWEPISATGNGCTTSYQCIPNGNGQTAAAPTAQLSCSPKVADVNESVAISYSCGNSTSSSGSGFSTNNQSSGSASTTIATPPSGTNTASYGLTCTNSQGQTAGAQCSIEINQPEIVMVANPATVTAGQTSTIGWVTAGMQSCVISSPTDANFTAQNAKNLSANGVAQTDPITANTQFDLSCTTYGGQTKTSAVTISLAASSTAATSTTQ